MSDTACDAYLAEHDARHLEELKTLLRIPSISSLPEHRADVLRAAEWVADQLRTLGAQDVALLPSSGNPVVYAKCDEGAPRTIAIYWQYDTMPITQPDAWKVPPSGSRQRSTHCYGVFTQRNLWTQWGVA